VISDGSNGLHISGSRSYNIFLFMIDKSEIKITTGLSNFILFKLSSSAFLKTILLVVILKTSIIVSGLSFMDDFKLSGINEKI
jgi:hypothetical protein